MKRPLVVLSALILAQSAGAQSQQGKSPNRPDPPMRPHFAKGSLHIPGTGGNPDLSWQKGPVLPGTAVKAIFWGTSWATDTSDKIGGLDSFYWGVGGSSFAKTSDEYSGSNGQVTSTISYSGHIVDSSPAPSGAPSTSQVLAEVCKEITPTANGYYPVYVDTPRGKTGYCAWHSWGSCGTMPVQFAFFFKLDGDSGCDPNSAVPNQSQGLAALANVSGHELSEARTDPTGAGWINKQGQENGDLCAWTFGTMPLTFVNGSQWKIQGNWSNTAYSGRFGYANYLGQKGCLDGGSYPAVAQ